METTTAAPAQAPPGMPPDAAALFDVHYAALCRLARVIVGDADRAEELVMEAFLRTLVSWRRLRDADRAPAYLQRVVVNLARSAVRRQAVERRLLGVVHHREPSRVATSADARADADPVLRAVAALPPRQRAAVALRYYADLAEADVATALGCSVGTVKSQLAKARASLARALAAEENR
jgi:RNA polymerase sigma-70 factor (sigma-E family)